MNEHLPESRFEAAFNYVERAKSCVLVEMIAHSLSEIVEHADSEIRDLFGEIVELSHEEQAIQSQFEPSITLPRNDLPSRDDSELTNRLCSVRDKREHLEEELRSRSPEWLFLERVDALELEAIREKVLDEETVLLEYYQLDDETTLAFLIDKKEGILSVEQISTTDMKLKDVVDSCLPPADDLCGLTNAYQLLLPKSIRTALRLDEDDKLYKRLIIVPHGILHRFPFHALTSNGECFLIDVFRRGIVYTPSTTALSYCQDSRKKHGFGKNVLILANPLADNVDENLPSSEEEGKKIKKLFNEKFAGNAELLLGNNATKAALRSRISGKDVLHISTHGVHLETGPNLDASMESYIKLSDGRGGEDLFTVRDVFTLMIETTIVVLAACLVGRSEVRPGDELIGQSRGWFLAGTPSLIAALWEVPDESSAILMKNFYYQWQTTKDKGQALRQAIIDLRQNKKYINPYFWAPFILLGDWQ